MGKKDKTKKKGKGAEKTAFKTEKKLTAKQKKELAAIGEDDIEKIVAQIEKEEQKRLQVVEHTIGPPSRRVNFSFTPHPDKDELIMFGGEYFNGQKTVVYNDLFFYNIPKNEWVLVKAPGGPPPRCGHQAVAVASGKGQLWVFGGEFASETQAQFYHYRDLWVYHLATKKWEKINSPGGPSARSGHRMVQLKKQLFVFGGFHDNLRDYKYFNDLHAFDLESYTWKKLEPTGTAPAPRSGCQMVALPEGKILVFGGYSKERLKKDVDKGRVHSDMFLLSPDKHDTTGTKWKWQVIKQGGVHISPRCSVALTVVPGNRAYMFGGVWDVEDNEEDLSGTFYNDLHLLDLEKYAWRTVTVCKKNPEETKRRRRKDKAAGGDADEEGGDDMETSDGEVETVEEESTVVADDGVFKMTIGPSTTSLPTSESASMEETAKVFAPSPRINCGLAFKHGSLFLYGGMIEDGDKQFTLSDFYSLDIHKLEEWKVIIPSDLNTQEWLDSGSSESEGSGESDDDDDEEEESENCESNGEEGEEEKEGDEDMEVDAGN